MGGGLVVLLKRGIKILGTGSSVPNLEVHNSVFEKFIETSDEWITKRTGIKTRRFLQGDETALHLCDCACKKAIENAGVNKSDIGLIIVGTLTPDYLIPSMACLIQKTLALPERVLAFDLNAACSGFVYSLNVAYKVLQGSLKRYALVVGVDIFSKVIDYTDRDSCILFGDGAGAAVIELSDEAPFVFESGAVGGAEHLNIPLSFQVDNPIITKKIEPQKQVAYMNGQEIYQFVQDALPQSASLIFEQAGIAPSDIDYFICHQANLRMLKAVAKKMCVPFEKFYINIDKYGNTSAASIAIALDELNRSGGLQRGQKIMLSGFGGGLTYGSAFLIW